MVSKQDRTYLAAGSGYFASNKISSVCEHSPGVDDDRHLCGDFRLRTVLIVS